MIELILINADLEQIAIIKNFSSLQWTEKYYELGNFEIHFDTQYTDVLSKSKYIFRKDKSTMGVIEYFKLETAKAEITIKGRFLESILEKRVIDKTTVYNDTAENIARKLVTDFCLTGDRAIPYLRLGNFNNLGTVTSLQRTGKTVLNTLFELLNEQELSYKIYYDLSTKQFVFEVYQGLDRTQSQNVNNWCVFSKSFYNIISETYTKTGDIKNFAYVAGGGESEIRKVIEVDLTNGAERKELYVDARDLQEKSGISEREYDQLLYDRGISKLAEYNISETISFVIDENAVSEYNLGDKCSYVNAELGIIIDDRVTEEYEVVEPNEISKNITFGKEQLTLQQNIKRSVM